MLGAGWTNYYLQTRAAIADQSSNGMCRAQADAQALEQCSAFVDTKAISLGA